MTTSSDAPSGSDTAPARPRGRDAVIDSLVAAAGRLFAEQGVDNVGVREIAREANVNPGLVHRHFDGKSALVAATFAQDTRNAMARIADSDEPSEVATELFGFVVDNPSFAKTLASVIIGSIDLAEVLPTEGPLRTMYRMVIEDRGDDAIADYLLAVALGLGWSIFTPLLQNLSELDDAAFLEQQELVIRRTGEIVAGRP